MKVDKYAKYVKEMHSPPVKPKKESEETSKKRSTTGYSPESSKKNLRASINHSELRKAIYPKRMWEVNKPKSVNKSMESHKITYKDYLKDLKTNREDNHNSINLGGSRNRENYLEPGALTIF